MKAEEKVSLVVHRTACDFSHRVERLGVIPERAGVSSQQIAEVLGADPTLANRPCFGPRTTAVSILPPGRADRYNATAVSEAFRMRNPVFPRTAASNPRDP